MRPRAQLSHGTKIFFSLGVSLSNRTRKKLSSRAAIAVIVASFTASGNIGDCLAASHVWFPTPEGRWTGLSSEDMRAAHMTDCKTGKALELEKAVRFLDWSDGVAASPSLTSNRPTKD
jgi:hypothetical protein